MRDSEDFLVERARGGDHAAVETLLEKYRARLRHMVALRMDDQLSARFDPSDVVQEALKIAYQRLPAYLRKPTISFYPWLRQIAWNCLIDLHRHHVHVGKRSVRREEPLGLSSISAIHLADQLLANETNPLRRLIEDELRTRLQSAMAQLSPAHCEILVLRYLEQLSGPECAQVLGISEKAANQRHVRAVRKLRAILEDLSEDET